jgi:cobalt-zinc-cadmium efflux system outer membrane protein
MIIQSNNFIEKRAKRRCRVGLLLVSLSLCMTAQIVKANDLSPNAVHDFIAAMPPMKPAPASTFPAQPQFTNSSSSNGQTQIPATPPLRGVDPTQPVTLQTNNPIRKLHVDMGDTVSPFGWRVPTTNDPNAEHANDVPGGVTPVKVRQALNEALLNSPRVASTRALLGISKALYAAATQLPDPVYYRDEAPQSEGVRRNGVNVTYELPWKLAFRLLAAKRQVQETKMEILHTLWQFRNDVRRAYVEMVVAQETYDTLHDLSELALRLEVVSQKRFQAGDVPELDVLKARLAYSQAGVDTAQGNMRVNRSRQQLNVILGRQFAAPISAPRLPAFDLKVKKSDFLPDYDLPVPPVADFISEAMENRLELKVNAAQIRLAKAQLLNAQGNIIPNPQIAFGQSTETNLPSGPKLNGAFTTINIEAPLYTFSQGDIARLRATVKQLKLQDSAIRNQVIADVTSAYNNLITARNRIQTYQDHVLADSAEVARLARRSYEVGQSDITATLAAQQANFQVRQAYLDAVSSYQGSFTDLEQAIGEPID